MWMLSELLWPLRRKQLPPLRLAISDDVRTERGATTFEWKKVRAFHPHTGAFLGRVRICVVPVVNRMYVSALWVEPPLRRHGYATSMIVTLFEQALVQHPRLAMTPLRENLATQGFWQHMRELAPRSLPVTRYFHPPSANAQDTDWHSSVVSSLLP